MSKKFVIRVNNVQPLDQIEDPKPREVVEYHWNRIFGVLFLVLLVVLGLVWGGLQIRKTAKDNPEVENDQSEIFKSEAAKTEIKVQLPMAAYEADRPSEVTQSVVDSESRKRLAAEAATEAATTPAEISDSSQSTATEKPTVAVAKPAPAAANTMTNSAQTATPVTAANTATSTSVVSIHSKHLKRVQLASGWQDEEPIDKLGPVIPMNDQGLIKVFLFMETAGLKGKTLYHDWYWKGKKMARVKIRVEDNSSRQISTKFIDRIMRGDWEAQIVDGQDKVLAKADFTVR